ncbi:hypothetical protein PORY_001866 [Pneumocystis oryctolagi]|uniref:Uncharacterized protein n=1 Tax=Pneumocystis oryctolagi TaxID=42067 RepID=A0ACB7CB75_9ASCO|nr:hypothetical protein PORY_001866 [Pneumocystis oryctolagi]
MKDLVKEASESLFSGSLDDHFEWFNHALTLTKLSPLFRFSKDSLSSHAREMAAAIRRSQQQMKQPPFFPADRREKQSSSSSFSSLCLSEMCFIACRWIWVPAQQQLGGCVWMVFEFTQADEDIKRNENVFSVTRAQGSSYACFLVSLNDEPKGKWGDFPLLISRVPGDLLHIVITYLTTRFDTWAAPFRLSTETLAHLLQIYILSVVPASEEAAKPLELTFSTKGIKGLKRITVGIRGQDAQVWKERESGFFEGLKKHLECQTAIDFNQLELCRIGCGGFIAAAEGKLKILKPIQQQVISEILKIEVNKGNMEIMAGAN